MNAYRSARTLLRQVFPALPEQTWIFDIGCGDGGWLLAAHELAPEAKLLGVDLDPRRSIPAETQLALRNSAVLVPMDLRNPAWIVRPVSLTICVEVAEHLPYECGVDLVDLAASLEGPVLWSAAAPGQGPYPPEGFEGWSPSWHWNEQPSTYWEGLFTQRGYEVEQEITTRLRTFDASVDPWYTSNAMLFVRRAL